jgi:Uma2 family endonuclease
MSTVVSQRTTVGTEIETVADLLRELGVDASRVRMHPPPGKATEEDVLAVRTREKRSCELIDGVLVEKVMGHFESCLAMVLGGYLFNYLSIHNLGYLLGADGLVRLTPGQVRLPDVAFVRWDRVPQSRVPHIPIPNVVPNLAVEVLSVSNTRTEMTRKRRDYFDAGIELVWQVDPEEQTCEGFTSPDESVVIGIDGVVDGGTVLPGFELPLREFFDRAERGSQQPAP